MDNNGDNFNSHKRNSIYAKQIDMEKIKRQIYNRVEESWHIGKQRKTEHKKVARKIRYLIWKYKVVKNPTMIPVIVIKLKSYIRENCPEYTKRFIK